MTKKERGAVNKDFKRDQKDTIDDTGVRVEILMKAVRFSRK
jgi:hypothetical protein